MDTLRAAWEEVAENRGIPGVDNISIRRWRRNWEERLVKLAQDVRTNRYKPARLRVRRIPKKRRDEYHDTYSYIWQDKTIEVEGNEVDWLFSRYGPDY